MESIDRKYKIINILKQLNLQVRLCMHSLTQQFEQLFFLDKLGDEAVDLQIHIAILLISYNISAENNSMVCRCFSLGGHPA